jgi:hypothetical protein
VRTTVKAVAILLVLAMATIFLRSLHAEERLGPWQVETCWTNQCIANLLNSLPPERAAEAKLTTWDDKTYVWYRR